VNDAGFRQLCLTAPATAVKEQSGKDLPDNFAIRFVENRGANLTIVLPDPIPSSGELSDTELESVAGGGKACVASCGGSECAVSNVCGVSSDTYNVLKR
jgi:hypothetical protein